MDDVQNDKSISPLVPQRYPFPFNHHHLIGVSPFLPSLDLSPGVWSTSTVHRTSLLSTIVLSIKHRAHHRDHHLFGVFPAFLSWTHPAYPLPLSHLVVPGPPPTTLTISYTHENAASPTPSVILPSCPTARRNTVPPSMCLSHCTCHTDAPPMKMNMGIPNTTPSPIMAWP